MDWITARARFAFLAEAFDGCGGFTPSVEWQTQVQPDSSARRVPFKAAPCHLVPYPRESAAKFAGRCAVAVYENHLRSACEKFLGFLGRRRPQRDGIDAPLAALLLGNADMRGSSLDAFWTAFALQAKARGSMLLLIDLPKRPEATSLQDQIERRAVPYLRAIAPEQVLAFQIDDETGLFTSLTIATVEEVGGKLEPVQRTWTTVGWLVRQDDTVLDQGEHPFGQCPVLGFTESGQTFPHVGKYAQIADLSRRIFNARSEQDEILRSQTFSLLTMQVPPEAASQFDSIRDKVAETIGTHSMLMHPGDTPAFIAPDSGPAEVYEKKLAELQTSIRRIAMEEATESGTQAESGVARRLRFEALNADLATFAGQLQALELRMWALFHRALGTDNRVAVTWPTDFNLADVAAELDILALMQAGGFPQAVLNAKRRAIAASEFDNAPDDEKARITAAIDELDQAAQSNTTP
jgi:hypothetical protein